VCAEVSDGDTEEAGDEVADGADGADNAGIVVRGVFADDAGFGVDAHSDEGEHDGHEDGGDCDEGGGIGMGMDVVGHHAGGRFGGGDVDEACWIHWGGHVRCCFCFFCFKTCMNSVRWIVEVLVLCAIT